MSAIATDLDGTRRDAAIARAERRVHVVRRTTGIALFLAVMATVVIMTSYTYLKALVPSTPYLKDLALLATAAATLLKLATSGRMARPTVIDVIVAALAAYLVFQLARTALALDNAAAAYYGFRLTFLPIVAYFGFAALDDGRHRRTIERFMSAALVAGAFITVAEVVLVTAGIVPRELMFRVASVSDTVKDYAFGGFMRPVGIAGTPQLTGTFNVLLVAMLVFATRDGAAFLTVPPRWRRWLLLVGVAAVIVSTSRTAISVLVVMLAVMLVRLGGRERLTMLVWIVLPLAGLAYALWQWLWTSGTVQTYLAFLPSAARILDAQAGMIWDRQPALGFGYEVGVTAPVDVSRVPIENLETSTDLFFLQLFKMLGAVGLGLFVVLFLLAPLYLVMTHRHAGRTRAVAAATVCIGLSFVHYNPLQSPPLAAAAWYLLAYLSDATRRIGALSRGTA